ncbi:PDR/VanB family oxidoreductase [Microbacterium karelineae]|uniref:PDR/VanB family oxidoreductase n=1 Tax=Microbacterium karelineae TaxID=2654283 RepID=UPI0018D40CE3|nr:PDR/VanB family oxidoreductase [Microbacterium karelineae]
MSFFSDVERELVVLDRAVVADGIVALELGAVNGRPLPAWEPGAHIDLLPEAGLERQYSLCGDPEDRTRWRVAVLRDDAGRGGSIAAHRLRAGAFVRARGPRSNFAFAEPSRGERAVFVAGGIGITPILPMVRRAREAGADWTLHVCVRTRTALPFADELAEFGERVHLHVSDEGTRADMVEITETAASAPVWACGPGPMLDALIAAAPAALHIEQFSAADTAPAPPPAPFEIELLSTGAVLDIPAERSILDVLEDNGVFAVSSCREGTCGTCETVVVEGEVDHRDRVLSAAERVTSPVMMICVSRAACPRLVLDV